jgi:hypothetical protein
MAAFIMQPAWSVAETITFSHSPNARLPSLIFQRFTPVLSDTLSAHSPQLTEISKNTIFIYSSADFT